VKEKYEITKAIISDINKLIEEFNKTFNPSPLSDYFKKIDNQFMCSWPDIENYQQGNNEGIVYHLGELALLIKKDGFDWMTFMIQNPYSSDFKTIPFSAFNFGIKDISEREEWDNWLKDTNVFTFTKLFFIQALPVSAYSNMFCVRINRSEPVKDLDYKKDKDLIIIDVSFDNNKADFNSIYCDDVTDESIGESLKNNIENILQEKGENAEESLLKYILNMERFTKLNKEFNYLYAIPVLSSFLYPATSSRSGLYLVSKEPIPYVTLKKVQEIITPSLCHIDYIRGALIQKETDVKVIIHDLKTFIVNLDNRIYSIEQSGDSIASQNIKDISLLSCIIYLLVQILTVNKNNLTSIVLSDIIEELINKEDWIRNLADKLGQLRHDKKAIFNYKNDINYIPNTKNPKMNVLIGILIVIFNNLWKHLPENNNKRIINIHINQSLNDRKKVIITITNKASKDTLKKIQNRESFQLGTFAVVSLMNSLIYKDIIIEKDFNSAKEELLNVIHIPKSWFKSREVFLYRR